MAYKVVPVSLVMKLYYADCWVSYLFEESKIVAFYYSHADILLFIHFVLLGFTSLLHLVYLLLNDLVFSLCDNMKCK